MRHTWIHVTDLHFGVSEKEIAEQAALLSRISDDITDVCSTEKLAAPASMFVTGDLIAYPVGDNKTMAKRSASAQFANTSRWLRALATKLEINHRYIYIVPGNHDVVWPLHSEHIRDLNNGMATLTNPSEYKKVLSTISTIYSDRCLSAIRDPETSNYTDVVFSGLSPYMSACRRFSFANATRPVEMGKFYLNGTFWARQVLGPDSHILILGLNTAWSCSEATNHLPSLPTGLPEQLQRLLDDARRTPLSNSTCALTIGLAHHPLGWYLPAERMASDKLLHQYVDVLLRGHEHIDWINQYGFGLLEISSPATFQKDKRKKRGYSVVEFDSVTRRCRVYVREFDYLYQSFSTVKSIRQASANGGAKSQLVQLASPQAHADKSLGFNSKSFVRRFGFTTDDLSQPQLPTSEGAIVAFDIFRFSSMSIDHQIDAVRKLWRQVSADLAQLAEPMYAACMPMSDGAVVAIFHSDVVQAAAHAVTIGNHVVSSLSEYGRLPTCVAVRGGIAVGKIGLLHQMLLESTVITGTCVNVARKAAFVADPWTIACADNIATTSHKRGRKNAVLDSNEFVSLSMTMEPVRQVIIETKNIGNVSAFRQQKQSAAKEIVEWGENALRSMRNQNGRKIVCMALAAMRITSKGLSSEVISELSPDGAVVRGTLKDEPLMSRAIDRHRVVFVDSDGMAKTIDGSVVKGGRVYACRVDVRAGRRCGILSCVVPLIEQRVEHASMAIPIVMIGTSGAHCGEWLARKITATVRRDFPVGQWRALHAIYA